MIRSRYMVKTLIMTVLAVACGALTLLYPQWRDELSALDYPQADPCGGKCTFTAQVDYKAEDDTLGRIRITDFKLQIRKKSDAKGCHAEVNFAPKGLLEWFLGDDTSCTIQTTLDFLESEKNCGAKIKDLSTIEKSGDFIQITFKGIEEITCNPNEEDCKKGEHKGVCQGPDNVDTFTFNFKFQDGKVTHDGTEKKDDKDKGKVKVSWEKTLNCKATCQ